MNIKCPKCSYQRKDTDISPEYECPSCGIIYSKYKPKKNREESVDKIKNEIKTEIESTDTTETGDKNATPSKKDNPIAYVVLAMIFIFGIYAFFSNHSSGNKKIQSNEEQTLPSPTPVYQKPGWRTSESRDKMTGEFEAYAISPTIYPTEKMDFPYTGVNSWLGVGCTEKNIWVYFGFNEQPNIVGDETKDGYNEIRTRIKWGKELEYVTLTQTWGAKVLHFYYHNSFNDTPVVNKILSSDKILLELKWHGEGATYFEYPLDGAKKAITEIRNKCFSNK